MINERLKIFLKAEGLTQAQFADIIRLKQGSISHILSGRNKPSCDFFCNCLKYFPRLNLKWLILGKDTMYLNNSSDTSSSQSLIEQNVDNVETVDDNSNYPSDYVVSNPKDNIDDNSTDCFEDGLFSMEQYNSASNRENVKILNSQIVNTSDSPIKLIDNENVTSQNSNNKKITRIIVFYDDNSFEEVISNN